MDTLRSATKMKERGLSPDLAEATVSIMGEAMLENFATKQDLKDVDMHLNHKMELLESRLTLKLGSIIARSITVVTALNQALFFFFK